MFICVAGANAQTQQKSSHSAAHKRLLANQAKGKDQIRLVEKNSFIDLIDDIEPEPDIYTEGWNSKRVNPFRESDVPNRHVIFKRARYVQLRLQGQIRTYAQRH